MIRLIFWMNIPAFYQSDLFRSLAATREVDLHVIYTGRIPKDRVDLGWQDDLKGFNYEFLSEKSPTTDAAAKAWKYRRHLHIVNGLWAGRTVEAVLSTLMLSGADYYIYSESPDPRQTVSPFKKKLLDVAGTMIVRRAKGLLPVSRFAKVYFESYGATENQLHPFGYFRSAHETEQVATETSARGTVDIVFVGQLVHRKGVDILIEAIEPIMKNDERVFLHLIGSGEKENEFKQIVAAKNLSERIIFDGSLDPGAVVDRISSADLLVLPSRWDGWGLVVNEALMAGTPVIVSSRCGAADLVTEAANGFVFESEDISDLKMKLSKFLGDESLRSGMKTRALATGRMLDTDTAAGYLLSIISGSHLPASDSARSLAGLLKH